MGAIIAKLDQNNKVISVTADDKLVGNQSLNKYRDYLNKHGIFRVNINLDQMSVFLESYLKKIYNISDEELKRIQENVGGQIKFNILMLTSLGAVAISDKESIEYIQSNPMKPTISEMNVKFETCNKVDNFEGFNNLNYGGCGKNVEMFANETTPETNDLMTSKKMELIIPKIFLTCDRNEFINFLSKNFGKSPSDQEAYELLKQFLDAISTKTPVDENGTVEIKVANLIGLLIRVIISRNAIKFVNNKNNQKEDKKQERKIITGIISEFLENFPSDRCIFYNNKMDFITFAPNLCSKSWQPVKCPNCNGKSCPNGCSIMTDAIEGNITKDNLVGNKLIKDMQVEDKLIKDMQVEEKNESDLEEQKTKPNVCPEIRTIIDHSISVFHLLFTCLIIYALYILSLYKDQILGGTLAFKLLPIILVALIALTYLLTTKPKLTKPITKGLGKAGETIVGGLKGIKIGRFVINFAYIPIILLTIVTITMHMIKVLDEKGGNIKIKKTNISNLSKLR